MKTRSNPRKTFDAGTQKAELQRNCIKIVLMGVQNSVKLYENL